ncbi:MAG: class I SAM-dependent methyltransferase [Anaerolineaceae bacterium]|nr:class I SAM-dependent methyltransferase [Anaerolineaceae bacterium]
MEIVTTCNLCGSEKQQRLYHLKDWLLERDDVLTTLVKCTNCGLIYQSPRPKIDEIINHYPDDYEPYQAGLAILKNKTISRLFLEIGLGSKVQLVSNVRKGGALLDVGCASGLFLNKMKQKRAWTVQGVEINPVASELAQKEFGLNIFTGTLEEAKYDDMAFDVVTLWDVLEHLHDPASSLREIHRILKPNGIIILRLPNVDSVDSRLFSMYWSGFDSPRHLFVFGRKTIKEILRNQGFTTLRIDTSNGEYMGFLLSLRMFLYAKNVKKSTRELVITVLSHPVIRILLFPIFSLWAFTGYGTQMSVIAIKKSSK